MKLQKKSKAIKVTPEILQALQESMNDTIKPDFKKERSKDAPKKKRRNNNKKQKK
jgi:hypothetical protein